MGVVEIRFYFLLEIQVSFFLGIPIFQDLRFQKFRFQVSQKIVQVVSLYTYFQGFFLLKVQKGCVYMIMLFLVLAPFKFVFDVKKRYKQVIGLGSYKTYCLSYFSILGIESISILLQTSQYGITFFERNLQHVTQTFFGH